VAEQLASTNLPSNALLENDDYVVRLTWSRPGLFRSRTQPDGNDEVLSLVEGCYRSLLELSGFDVTAYSPSTNSRLFGDLGRSPLERILFISKKPRREIFFLTHEM
jgi:hypothetical protein